jgi:hypothetical protein
MAGAGHFVEILPSERLVAVPEGNGLEWEKRE